MDSEKLGEVTTGCAGVTTYTEQKSVPMVEIVDSNHKKITISISGGNGGHSVVHIHDKHIYPINTIFSVLWEIPNIKLASINGGTKFNAIPKDAEAVIYVPQENTDEVLQRLNAELSSVKQAHSDTDPKLQVSVVEDSTPASSDEKVVDPEFQEKLFRIAGKQISSELISTYDDEHIKEEKNKKT